MDLSRIASRVAFDSEEDADRIDWWSGYLRELGDEARTLVRLLETAQEQVDGIRHLDPEARRAALIALAIELKTEIPNSPVVTGMGYVRDRVEGEVRSSPYYRVGDDQALNGAVSKELQRLRQVFKALDKG